MKILIADAQKSIPQGLSKLLESEPEIEIVGMAENGQIALEKAEQLLPDLIIMDMQMPVMDGITATEIITHKFPQSKIIILTSSSEQLFAPALSAGARGFLLKGTSPDDFLAAINAVNRGKIVYLGQNHEVTNPQNSTKPIEKLPDEIRVSQTERPKLARLKNWNVLLAAETINWWLTSQKSELPSYSEALILLGIRADSSNLLVKFLEQGELPNLNLFQELELRLDTFSSDLSNRSDSIENLEKKISHWYHGNYSDDGYTCCLTKLQSNSQILRIELVEKFQQFVNSFWSKTSPQPCLEYLEKLEVFLVNIYQKYEQEQQNYIQQEKAGKRAYNYLLSQIIKSSSHDQTHNNYQIAIKALLHIYKSKIKAEICCLASQALKNIIKINQLYLDDLLQTHSFLKRIRNNLLAQKINNILLPILFEQMCTLISPEDLCKELEQELGHSLNQWGICGYIDEEKVKHLLLEKIAKITRKIHEQLKSEFFPSYYLKVTSVS